MNVANVPYYTLWPFSAHHCWFIKCFYPSSFISNYFYINFQALEVIVQSVRDQKLYKRSNL